MDYLNIFKGVLISYVLFSAVLIESYTSPRTIAPIVLYTVLAIIVPVVFASILVALVGLFLKTWSEVCRMNVFLFFLKLVIIHG